MSDVPMHGEEVERRLDLLIRLNGGTHNERTVEDLIALVEFVEAARAPEQRTSLFLNGPFSVSFEQSDVDSDVVRLMTGTTEPGQWGQPAYGSEDAAGFTEPPNYDDLPTGGRHAVKPFVCLCNERYAAQAMLDHHITALEDIENGQHADVTDYAAVAEDSTTSEGDVPDESTTGKDD